MNKKGTWKVGDDDDWRRLHIEKHSTLEYFVNDSILQGQELLDGSSLWLQLNYK